MPETRVKIRHPKLKTKDGKPVEAEVWSRQVAVHKGSGWEVVDELAAASTDTPAAKK